MSGKFYCTFAEFASKSWAEIRSTVFYAVKPGKDTRITFYVMINDEVLELSLKQHKSTITAYGPSGIKSTEPRWAGDKFTFTIGYGPLSNRPSIPTIAESLSPGSTHADHVSAVMVTSLSYLFRLIAEDAMVFPSDKSRSYIFAEGTPYSFDVPVTTKPRLTNQLNSSTRRDWCKAHLPKFDIIDYSIRLADFAVMADTWITKFQSSSILAGYASKAGGKALQVPYLTLYLPQLDYRSPANQNATSTMVLIRVEDYDAAMAKCVSANKPTETPPVIHTGDIRCYEIPAWRLLDVPTGMQGSRATTTICVTPEFYFGQTSRFFRMVISDVHFGGWQESVNRARPMFDLGESDAEAYPRANAEVYTPA